MKDFKMPDDLKGTRLYFAYGSNMSPKQLEERGLKMSVIGVGVLLNYKLMFNKISKKDPTVGFANILPCWGKSVHGVVYDMANLNDNNRQISSHTDAQIANIVSLMRSNLSILDKSEGYPTHYQRTSIGVRVKMTERERHLDCFTYMAGLEMSSQTNLLIRDSYIEKISEGLDAHSINEEYKEEVKSLMNIWKTT